ncbi:AMP-binding protein, partial [Nocardia cyriacigeorgica]|uniref:AMP-binding protein n=1 Tax=Nocardia cyriacigeorgica TaxID=135487 RepID=UPI002453FE26
MTTVTVDHLDNPAAYPPPAEFAANANAGAALYDRAAADRLEFWAEQARRLHWERPWNQVLDWSNAPYAEWFAGGTLNVAYNCVDRHVLDGHGDQVAIHWEGEPGDSRSITYRDLLAEVSRAANYFTELGLVAGDRVAIYMPMVPEAIVSMLACARLGLTHSVVFAGFSPAALRQRVDDAGARLVVTTDGQWRRGKPAPRKAGGGGARAGRVPGRGGLVGHPGGAVGAGKPGAAQGGGGRGAGCAGRDHRRTCARGAAHRDRGAVDRGPRSVVARNRRERLPRTRSRGLRRRTPAVHPLHLRHHRKT